MDEWLKKVLIIKIPFTPNSEEAESIFIENTIKAIGIDCSYSVKCITLEKQGRVSKTVAPITRKPELVKEIASSLNMEAASLEGLEKASKESLQALLASLETALDNEEDNEESEADEG